MLSKPVGVLWAKKEERNGRFYWLPLVQHLQDTSQIAGLLWEHWLSEGLKKYLVKNCGKDLMDEGKRVVRFLAAVHDIGKAIPAFQRMPGYNNSTDLDSFLWERIEGAGFRDFRTLKLTSPEHTHHSVAGQTLLLSFGLGEDLASIVGAHHGLPLDSSGVCQEQISAYASNYYQEENSGSRVNAFWKDVQCDIFKWALKFSEIPDIGFFKAISQPAQAILSGIVIMADWIASNTYYFPLVEVSEDAVVDQDSRLCRAWELWFVQGSWEPVADPLALSLYSDMAALFKKRFDFSKPRNIQQVFVELAKNLEKPGILILEAPMGVGKTEAALAAAELLAYRTGKNGVFFGLPTQATSNGIFPRIESWLNKLSSDFHDEDLSLIPRLVHGKAALNDNRRSNKTTDVYVNSVDLDGGISGRIDVNQWFAGRKTSNLEDFVVATVDQFLMLALKQKHLALRHLGFSKKVVIIDEVHAYDAYMSQYLYMAVEWMAAYDVPVIILSATLPQDKREDLVRHYMKGRNLKWKDVNKPPEGLDTTAYPLITYSDGDSVKQEKEFAKEDTRQIQVVSIYEEELPETIDRLYEAGGVVGIIVNTVKRAQALAEQCMRKYGEENIELLHSGFIATDRVEKEKRLMNMIGKGAKRPERKIIIGTQVLEQSLDIDFDILISDLAPVDLLIQRTGRLHRHVRRDRPCAHSSAMLYVLGKSSELDFEPGSRAVYGEYLLARTQYFLPELLTFPGDISTLVQRVYDENISVSFGGNLQEKYEKFKVKHKQLVEGKELKAKTYRIDNPQFTARLGKPPTLIGWLNNLHPNESDERAYAQVRDSNETIEIIALKKIAGGYGFFDSEEDISQNIESVEVAREVAKHTISLPSVLSLPWNITATIEELEKYNLNSLKNWQEQAWLKGALGVIFDCNNEFVLNGYRLRYDVKLGLRCERLENG